MARIDAALEWEVFSPIRELCPDLTPELASQVANRLFGLHLRAMLKLVGWEGPLLEAMVAQWPDLADQ